MKLRGVEFYQKYHHKLSLYYDMKLSNALPIIISEQMRLGTPFNILTNMDKSFLKHVSNMRFTTGHLIIDVLNPENLEEKFYCILVRVNTLDYSSSGNSIYITVNPQSIEEIHSLDKIVENAR